MITHPMSEGSSKLGTAVYRLISETDILQRSGVPPTSHFDSGSVCEFEHLPRGVNDGGVHERLPQFRIAVLLTILAAFATITIPLLLAREDAAFVFAIILTVLLLAAFGFVLYVLLVDAIHQSKNQKVSEANQEKEHQARMKVAAEETSQLERLEDIAAELWSDEFRELVDAAVAAGDDPDRYPDAVLAVGQRLTRIDSALLLVLPSAKSPIWPILVVKLERILRLRKPSVEDARLVWNLAARCDSIMDFLPYAKHWAESRKECRACATFHTLTQNLPLP